MTSEAFKYTHDHSDKNIATETYSVGSNTGPLSIHSILFLFMLVRLKIFFSPIFHSPVQRLQSSRQTHMYLSTSKILNIMIDLLTFQAVDLVTPDSSPKCQAYDKTVRESLEEWRDASKMCEEREKLRKVTGKPGSFPECRSVHERAAQRAGSPLSESECSNALLTFIQPGPTWHFGNKY